MTALQRSILTRLAVSGHRLTRSYGTMTGERFSIDYGPRSEHADRVAGHTVKSLVSRGWIVPGAYIKASPGLYHTGYAITDAGRAAIGQTRSAMQEQLAQEHGD